MKCGEYVPTLTQDDLVKEVITRIKLSNNCKKLPLGLIRSAIGKSATGLSKDFNQLSDVAIEQSLINLGIKYKRTRKGIIIEGVEMKTDKLNESINFDDEFFELQDVIGTALNSIGGDMDDITGGITSQYDEDCFTISLYSTVDKKNARSFKKKFFEAVENALSQTRFSDVSADEDHTFAYQLSRLDLHNHLGSDRGDEFASKFAMFEILITAYGEKLEESVKGKNLTEWNEFSDDDFDDDQMHAAVYGGDSKYCKDCGTVKVYDEDGFAYCPKCNESLNEAKIFGAKGKQKLDEAGELLPIEVLNSDGTPKQYDVKFMELEKVPGLLNWDVADQLEQHFRNNRLWVDELHYNEVKDCIEYDINWGDWKHEHLRSKWLLEELFKKLGIVAHINSHTTEEDGSDNYSAHYIVRAMGKMNEAITPPTGDDPDLSAIPQIGQEVMYRGTRTTIVDYEQDPEYGYDFLIKNPFWNGVDERFENIWVGDQIDFIDWGPDDIGLQPPG